MWVFPYISYFVETFSNGPDPLLCKAKIQTMNQNRSSFKFPPYTPGSNRASSHSFLLKIRILLNGLSINQMKLVDQLNTK